MDIIDLTEHDPINHSWLNHVRQGKTKKDAESHASFGKPEYNEESGVVPNGPGVPEMPRENDPKP